MRDLWEKETPTVKSVGEVKIKSKTTNKELYVTLTVSRWRDGGAVGKVRLGTTARGTDPERFGSLGDCCSEPRGSWNGV